MLGGCGGSTGRGGGTLSRAELQLQRTDLVVVSRGLRSIEAPILAEVEASRRVWPLIAKGLPRRISPAIGVDVKAARARAERVVLPSALAKAEALTGPPGGIAALLRSFTGLSERGWRLTEASISGMTSGDPATARFIRANVGLYINAVYDGHYNLAAIGETLRKAYVKLGAAKAFGHRLTRGEVDEIARVYSPALARLQPRPAPGLGR